MNSQVVAEHIEREMATIPDIEGSVEAVVRRGRRRRRARRTAWAVGALGLALLFVMFPVPYDPNPKAIAGEYEIPAAIQISDLEVAVENKSPVSTDPDVWIGWKHPTPEFDTSNLGTDRTFTDGAPSVDDPLDRERANAAVYLGKYEGQPFYIYAQDPPTIFDRAAEITHGNLSGQILGTSHACCSGGDMDIEEGLPGMSTFRAGVSEPTVTAEWLGLAPNISVVAIQVGDNYVAWQTPVGGVISMRLDHEPGADVHLVAFTANGEEVRRIGPWTMRDLDVPHPSEG
jgi:hypothetical protein